MKTIKCNRGKVAFVDDEMFDELNQYEWRASPGGYTFYAYRLLPRKDGKVDSISMHREVARLAGFPPSKYIDHRDRNGMNNQRENLRPATGSQNACNQRLPRSNRSGLRGVCWGTKRKKWIASISVSGERRYLGGFDSKEEAARVYDDAAVRFHGEFAQLNFPEALV
jgi:hypothetical protein